MFSGENEEKKISPTKPSRRKFFDAGYIVEEDLFGVVTAILGLSGEVTQFLSDKTKHASSTNSDTVQIYFLGMYAYWLNSINLNRAQKFLPQFKPNNLTNSFRKLIVNNHDNVSIGDFKNELKKEKHGAFLFVSTGWTNHCFGINFITEKINGEYVLHMIVVNGGERPAAHHDDTFLNKALQCYTFKHPISDQLLNRIYNTCNGTIAHKKTWVPMSSAFVFLKTMERTLLMQTFDELFCSSEFRDARNEYLSDKMSKSLQKVGNCEVANINKALHFQLATEMMQLTTQKLEDCYNETLDDYKQLRINARDIAFETLLDLRRSISDPNQWLDLIIQAIGKFASKEQRKDFNLSINSVFQKIEIEYNSQYIKSRLSIILSTFKL